MRYSSDRSVRPVRINDLSQRDDIRYEHEHSLPNGEYEHKRPYIHWMRGSSFMHGHIRPALYEAIKEFGHAGAHFFQICITDFRLYMLDRGDIIFHIPSKRTHKFILYSASAKSCRMVFVAHLSGFSINVIRWRDDRYKFIWVDTVTQSLHVLVLKNIIGCDFCLDESVISTREIARLVSLNRCGGNWCSVYIDMYESMWINFAFVVRKGKYEYNDEWLSVCQGKGKTGIELMSVYSDIDIICS